MRDVFGLFLALVCLFVFSNTSFAQTCKNGQCPQPNSQFLPQGYYIQPQQYILPKSGGCEKGNCPSNGIVQSGGFVIAPQSGFVIVPQGTPKTDCPNGKCLDCPCPQGSCAKGSCIGSSYSAKSVTTITVSKGGLFSNLRARRNR